MVNPKKKPSDLFVKAVIDDLQKNESQVTSEGRPSLQNDMPTNVLEKDPTQSLRKPDDPTSLISDMSSQSSGILDTHRISDETQNQVDTRVELPVDPKISFGKRATSSTIRSQNTKSFESALYQAENLQIAQNKILELEKEIEKLRRENEMLTSASEIAKQRAEEFFVKLQSLDRTRSEDYDQFQMELKIYKDTVSEKDKDLIRYRLKIDELETRLAADLKKIRVRERDLENRLELSRMERMALLKAKDEAILDLKKRVDELHSELQAYKNRYQELNIKMDSNHEQLSRTVKALRLALTHLEAHESEKDDDYSPVKKAE